jgi:hypothetical protein
MYRWLRINVIGAQRANAKVRDPFVTSPHDSNLPPPTSALSAEKRSVKVWSADRPNEAATSQSRLRWRQRPAEDFFPFRRIFREAENAGGSA